MVLDELSLNKDPENSEIIRVIDERIRGRNAARNRSILKRRLIDGVAFEPLAEEFDLTVRQCKRIVYSLTDHISKYF
jgi:hypothetical protein